MKGKSQPDGVIASIQTPKKSSSKSSVTSKSSKTSLKSTPAAQESIKNETSPEVSVKLHVYIAQVTKNYCNAVTALEGCISI